MEILEFYQNFLKTDINSRNDLLFELKDIVLKDEFNWVSEIFEKIIKDTEKDALIYYNMGTENEIRISYGDFMNRYNQFINFLKKHNIKKGASIYIMAGAVPEQWYSIMGSLKGGFTVIPSAPNLTEYELKYRFAQDPPDVIISDINNADKIDRSLKNSPLKICLSDKIGWINYSQINGEDKNAPAEKIKINDIFIKYFTSGTTGMPKAVKQSAILYPIGQLSTLAAIGIKENYIHNNLSSPGWAKFAWSSFFAPLSAGSTILIIDYSGKLNTGKYLEILDNYHVNSFCAPPTAWRQFLSIKTDVKLKQLHETVSAGEPLNGEIINKWKEKFGTTIRDFYGQSEATAMVANSPGIKVIPGSMGKPLKMYGIKLLDDDFNEIADPYKIGIISVKNYQNNYGLFIGYSDENKNREVFVNNYYLTGDKAYMDDSGYLYFVSRSDDVIKTSDYRVGPFEVESAIISNEAVLESAVIGSPDPLKYQAIKAFVILKENFEKNQQTAESIYKTVKNLLPYYKLPRIIEFTNELPKTISGKIKRNELRSIEIEKKSNNARGEYEYYL